jgi:isochorismate synthase
MEKEHAMPLEKRIEATALLPSLLSQALQEGDSIALWRLPNESQQQLVLSKSKRLLKEDETLEELSEGFMIMPFHPTKERTFLPADYYFRFEKSTLTPPNSPKEINSHTWFRQQTLTKSATPTFYSKKQLHKAESDKSSFVALVNKGVALIEQGVMEKIVPSRIKHIQKDFDLLEAFDKLCQRYPAAMVSLISTPEHGTWLGATPEVLVSIENNTIFKTVALAGTKAWHEGIDCKSVAWTQKEIEEQALVERYIISCFKKIRLREYEEHGPKTIIAGNLMHLKSDFTVDMKATNFPQLGSVMLKLLHPTSAVCGMPIEPALQFLQDNENYNRDLYSGYLGQVNIQNNTHLFVNLRCLQWQENNAILYAGAGVTIDSVAEKEWEETEMKMNTLLRVIL